jgi:predicted GIY-YIG superfamily endonuclease
MCKLQKIKGKDFIIYHLLLDNYIGVTTDLQKRLYKHSSKSGFCIDNDAVNILYVTKDLNDAFEKELEFQKIYKCEKGVRNQTGKKNPFAKQVLDLNTGIFYDTIKEACEALQYNYSIVRRLIKNENNKYNLIKI